MVSKFSSQGKKSYGKLLAMNLLPYLSSDLTSPCFFLPRLFFLSRMFLFFSISVRPCDTCRVAVPVLLSSSSLLSSLVDSAGDEGSRVWILRIDKVLWLLLRQKEGLSIFYPSQISSRRTALCVLLISLVR